MRPQPIVRRVAARDRRGIVVARGRGSIPLAASGGVRIRAHPAGERRTHRAERALIVGRERAESIEAIALASGARIDA